MAEHSARGHLIRYKTFRDPVHGDTWLTKLETEIIDTSSFQRLHRIKQLGCAYLVYPGAVHTRFSHSIGTLHSAQQLIDSIRNSPRLAVDLDPYSVLLVRLSALVHDLAHIPFGHTLEDEGNLFPAQWADNFRVEYFLGRKSEVGAVISKEVGAECLADVVQILRAKDDKDIEKLRYPFAADLIGDTFCADLLDYSLRDSYFAGLIDRVDTRLINHVTIGRPNRVVLDLGDKSRQVRRDIVAEAVHLLLVRYSLMEKVVYHHTKVRASAMIIEAVNDMLVHGRLTIRMLCDMGDETLLDTMARNGTDVSRQLVTKLRRRELYEPVYQRSYLTKFEQPNYQAQELFRRYSSPQERSALAKKLEQRHGLTEGSIVVYCPGVKISNKSSSLIVASGENVFPLSEIPDTSTRAEIALVEDRYRLLPKMLVLVDDQISGQVKEKIASDCLVELGSFEEF